MADGGKETHLESERTDRELLAAHLAGDEGAFEQLAARHAAMVLAACRRQLSGGDAEDAAQATFLVLVRKARSLASGQGDLGAWLHRAASNVARTARRALATRARHEKEAGAMQSARSAGHEPEPLWREGKKHLDAALDSLPENYSQALVLCYFEGLSQSQAAARLSIPESTVATRCSRGLEKLRARLPAGRGRRMSVAALGTLLLAHVPQAGEGLPLDFLPSVVAAAKGAAVSAPILALTEGALKVMFWSKLKVVGACLAAAAVLAVATPQAMKAISGEKPKPVAKVTPPPAVDGLRVTLTAGKTEFSPGEKVKLTLCFENVSKEKMRVFLPPANWLDRSLSWTASGPGAQKQMVARNMMARLSGLKDYPELAPGAKKTVELQLGGNPPQVTGWQLTRPGEYKLSVAYRYSMTNPMHYGGGAPGRGQPVPGKVWKGTVATNTLKLRLKKYDPAKGIDGLTLKLSADRKAAQAGDAVTLKLTFKNVSGQKMSICNYKLANYVKLTGPDDQSAIKAFRMMRTNVWRPRGPNKQHFIELAPGAQKKFTVKISGNPPSVGVSGNSTRTFLTKAGKYKLSVFYQNRLKQYYAAAPGARFPKRQPVGGKVWTGAIGSGEIEVEFKGSFKPLPATWRKAGKLGPGMLVPGGGGGGGLRPMPPGQIRPMKIN
jgi:RNA polymerase sigma factor (sigma-70 family)